VRVKVRRSWHLLLATLLLFACERSHRPTAPAAIHVRICDVVASPQRFEGKPISFRGRFSSDCHHGSTLNDFSCRYRGIGAYADDSMERTKADALNAVVCPPNPRDRFSSDATAVFTGVVRRIDKHPLLLYRGDFELVITNFEDLRVVKASI
jgi:hypothetical protein